MNNNPNLNQIELEQKTRSLDHFAETTVKQTMKVNRIIEPTTNSIDDDNQAKYNETMVGLRYLKL